MRKKRQVKPKEYKKVLPKKKILPKEEKALSLKEQEIKNAREQIQKLQIQITQAGILKEYELPDGTKGKRASIKEIENAIAIWRRQLDILLGIKPFNRFTAVRYNARGNIG